MSDKVILAHGGGGQLTSDFIDKHIVKKLSNIHLSQLMDSAVLPPFKGSIAMTTDSFVVQPLKFPGADIGRLAVCGTVNDLAVAGAVPKALSLGLIIEEGFSLKLLDEIIDSIALTAKEAGVPVVTGDTKVIEYNKGDGLIINTTGVGEIPASRKFGYNCIKKGDAIVINGGLAEHGLAVMSAREGLSFDSDLLSDAAPLNGLIEHVLKEVEGVRFMRDPTRSGVSGVLNDIAENCKLSVDVEEEALPLLPVVRHTAELLGLDPLAVANEGKVIFVVEGQKANDLIKACQNHPLGAKAAIIGQVTDASPPLVELITGVGGRRIVQRPYGEDLPRIC